MEKILKRKKKTKKQRKMRKTTIEFLRKVPPLPNINVHVVATNNTNSLKH